MRHATAISAHRGGAGIWPENSRRAFHAVRELAVDSVEFDVHRSQDGVLIVHHDPVLGRTCEGEGAIGRLPWSVLREFRLKDAAEEDLPLLAEVLEILGDSGLGLRIELKVDADGNAYGGMEREVVAAVDAKGLLGRTTFTSFDLGILERLAAEAPAAPLIYLVRRQAQADGDPIRACRGALRVGVGEIALPIGLIDADDSRICADEGVRLGAYAAKDGEGIRRALALGVCAFTTDRPDLAIELRHAMESPRS